MKPSQPALARLGESHGYMLDGDAAHMHATFREILPGAYDRSWALQLWACPAAPQSAANLDGHLVAQAWLPPLIEITEAGADFAVVATAIPPAGSAEWVMVLVLVAARGESFDEVHDFAVYERHERFSLPQLEGDVTQAVNGATVHLEVGGVTNPRPAGNISGTLSLELWALPAPYGGGLFEGAPLAGVVLGTLPGQERLDQLAFDLAYTPPPPDARHHVVMLREWMGHGYVTRDFFNFPVTESSPPPAPAIVPAASGGERAPKAPAKKSRVKRSKKSSAK